MEKKSSGKKITSICGFKAYEVVRVFGIVRASANGHVSEASESIDYQKAAIENWVRSKSSLHAPQKWQIVDIFEDVPKRAGLAKAMELAKLGLIEVVIVTKLDRLSRNTKDFFDIAAEFNENHVALVCLDLEIDLSTPDGEMILRNFTNLAQWQVNGRLVRKDKR